MFTTYAEQAVLRAEMMSAVLRRERLIGRKQLYTGGKPAPVTQERAKGDKVWRVQARFISLDESIELNCTLTLPYSLYFAPLEQQLAAVREALESDMAYAERAVPKPGAVFRKIIREDRTPAPVSQTRSRLLQRIGARAPKE